MYLFWRILYRALRANATVAAAAFVVRLAARVRGEDFARKLLDAFRNRFVWSGWPTHDRGWVNLDTSRFSWRVHDAVFVPARVEPRPPRRSPEGELRIGLVGEISRLLPTSPQLFRDRPRNFRLEVFDFEYCGRYASWVEGLVDGYAGFPMDEAPAAARAINDAQLDVLLVFLRGALAHEAVERVATPAVVYVCMGPDILHHERVAFSLYCQPEADYFVRGDRLFCGTTRAYFGSECAYEAFLFFDDRDLRTVPRRTWAQREPLIVYHGSLYKAATPSFVDVLVGLLKEDPELELVLAGKDNGRALDQIRVAARAAGVAGRVSYEGAFLLVRSDDGTISDPVWDRVCEQLSRARLAPDPWPVSGSSARVEACALGVPTPHLALRLDPASWGRAQPQETEHPALSTPSGTAKTIEAYRELCRRCLYDEAFADALVAEQDAVLDVVTDVQGWWAQVFDRYCRWLGVRDD